MATKSEVEKRLDEAVTYIKALEEQISSLEAEINGRKNREAALAGEITSLRSSLKAQAEALSSRPVAITLETAGVSVEGAINALQANGFLYVTDVKVDDCKEEGKRVRTFRHAKRYDLGLLFRASKEME